MAGPFLTAAAVLALAIKPECGANTKIPPAAVAHVALHESGIPCPNNPKEKCAEPLAIHVNGPGGRDIHPETLTEALATARILLAEGQSSDYGLTQINNTNLLADGLASIEEAFNACSSIRASYNHLAKNMDVVWEQIYSVYNTGKLEKGNRYAKSVMSQIVDPAQKIAVPQGLDAACKGKDDWQANCSNNDWQERE